MARNAIPTEPLEQVVQLVNFLERNEALNRRLDKYSLTDRFDRYCNLWLSTLENEGINIAGANLAPGPFVMLHVLGAISFLEDHLPWRAIKLEYLYDRASLKHTDLVFGVLQEDIKPEYIASLAPASGIFEEFRRLANEFGLRHIAKPMSFIKPVRDENGITPAYPEAKL